MKKRVPFGGITLAGVVLVCAFSFLVRSGPADLNLQAQLVWGTNKEKPEDPKLKEVEPGVAEKLRKVFKWKNYFEVKRQNFTVAVGSPKRVRMSDDCEIEVQNLASSSIEVKLYGKGKLAVRKTQKISPSELLVLAGDDKDDTAWFVVLNQSAK
jgi:hypothetical protein